MIVTEAKLREGLRQPRRGAEVVIPRGASLSPAARDFVVHWQLELVEQDAPAGSAQLADVPADRPDWDREGAFTVARDGEPPRCTSCGSVVTEKPDGLTQLNACHYAAKTHPRIRLRGRLDSLQAGVLLAGHRARAEGEVHVAAMLDTLAAYVRELLAAEYGERSAAPLELAGLDDAALRTATHDPASALGIPHLVPSADDALLALELNALRCAAREAELIALDAFPNPHDPSGGSITHGLNRLSSAVYYVALVRAAADRAGPEVTT